MNHLCPISGCTKTVSKDKLMCWAHWQQVPQQLKNRLYAAYRATLNYEGKEAEHHAAMQAAIESVRTP